MGKSNAKYTAFKQSTVLFFTNGTRGKKNSLQNLETKSTCIFCLSCHSAPLDVNLIYIKLYHLDFMRPRIVWLNIKYSDYRKKVPIFFCKICVLPVRPGG